MAETHAAASAHAPNDAGHGHASIKTYINVAVVARPHHGDRGRDAVRARHPERRPRDLAARDVGGQVLLVVGFFMHLKYDSRIFRSMFVGPLIIAILIILALMALFGAYVLLPRVVNPL